MRTSTTLQRPLRQIRLVARGRTVYVAGMIGWDAQCQFHTDDFAGQVRLMAVGWNGSRIGSASK